MPVVIMVQGGPESQFRPDFNFLAQFFLQDGYAVFAPNVRGSTGYGKTYSHLDDKDQRMDAVADLAYAAHWLRQQPGIDGGRLVLYGVSYGGFMVLSALANYSELWAAGIDIVGDSNLATFLENTSDYRRAHREAEYGSLAHYRVFLGRIGYQEGKGVTRTALSDSDLKARDWLAKRMHQAGLEVRVDAAGNMFGRLPAATADTEKVAGLGSHIDTVAQGGGAFRRRPGCLGGPGMCQNH